MLTATFHAVQSEHEIEEPVIASEISVRDSLEADFFLHRDDIANTVVLDSPELLAR
jgi:hypothetical protein